MPQKSPLKKEIMSDLTKILAENQKEILKLIVPTVKKTSSRQNLGVSNSEAESTFIAPTSNSIKLKRLFQATLR